MHTIPDVSTTAVKLESQSRKRPTEEVIKCVSSVLIPLLIAVFTVVIAIIQFKNAAETRIQDLKIAEEQREQEDRIQEKRRNEDRSIAKDNRDKDFEIANRTREQDLQIENDRRVEDRRTAEASRQKDYEIARQQRELDLVLADNRQMDVVLATYFKEMSDLFLSPNFTLGDNNIMATVIRAKTLTALRQMDTKRKAYIILFLFESKMLTNNQHPIDLSGADLDGLDLSVSPRMRYMKQASLRNISLMHISLANATFANRDLSDSNFNFATLSNVNFEGCHIERTSFLNATLQNTKFGDAFVRDTEFSGSDLNGSNISPIQMRYNLLMFDVVLPSGFLQRDPNLLLNGDAEQKVCSNGTIATIELEGGWEPVRTKGLHLENPTLYEYSPNVFRQTGTGACFFLFLAFVHGGMTVKVYVPDRLKNVQQASWRVRAQCGFLGHQQERTHFELSLVERGDVPSKELIVDNVTTLSSEIGVRMPFNSKATYVDLTIEFKRDANVKINDSFIGYCDNIYLALDRSFWFPIVDPWEVAYLEYG
ncbi:unnamed protein product [Adineta steineri]|uniref:Pentapeptide repeat-containing protein n=1 Tax=Adineta steineri TaxID=433720 RepID=A0A814XMD7_9BILA|nr:unnamed protein product [Adineta steineri]CAF1213416.1 unnamed protein product [Adineta steineri]